MNTTKPLIIGIGNRYRGDDAFGYLAIEELRRSAVPNLDLVCITQDGEPASLLNAWQGRDLVIIIDVVLAPKSPGSIYEFDLKLDKLPEEFNLCSTHAVGLAQVVELARVLDRLPKQLIFLGVAGSEFTATSDPSPALRNALPLIVQRALEIVLINA